MEEESLNKERTIEELRDAQDELERKSTLLEEENRELLAEKQSKDLLLAELKTKLERVQYVHREEVTQTLNKSIDLKEVNSSLLEDIERLNEVIEQKTEEQKGE